MTDLPVKIESAVEGVFRGFQPGKLVKLQDGSYWIQTSPQRQHHHAVNPQARILALDDGLFLQIAGIEETVAVRRLHGVIATQIKGNFNGWTGRSVYTLTNGQVWQQAKFQKKYAVKYMPDVLIYQDDGGHLMQVAGTLVRVRRLN